VEAGSGFSPDWETTSSPLGNMGLANVVGKENRGESGLLWNVSIQPDLSVLQCKEALNRLGCLMLLFEYATERANSFASFLSEDQLDGDN
jgi:hypothetical protein